MCDPSELFDLSLELIRCTRQPGELRISKGACVRQYNLARKKTIRNGAGPFGNSKLWTLEICRTCPKGRIYAQSIGPANKIR